MAYTKYSLTPANNNAAPPDGAPEGMLPSAVNDTMRDMMAQIRDCGDGIRGGTYTMTAPVITGGSISGSTMSSNVITGGSINNTPIGASTANTGAFTTLAYSSTFTGGTGVVNLGSGQFYKDATGNVGIGTSAPAQRLHLSVASGALFQQFTSGANSTFVGWNVADSLFSIQTDTGLQFVTGSGYTEKMRLTSSGNLGIGTTSPSLPLQITAGNKSGFNISYDNSSALRTGLFMWTAGGSDGAIGGGVEQTSDNVFTSRSTVASFIRFNNGETRFFNNGSLTSGSAYTPTERMRIDTSGNVGIGTSSPIAIGSNYTTLDIRGSSGGGLRFGNSTDAGYIYSDSTSTQIGTGTAKVLQLVTNGTERMRIEANGAIRVGTQSHLLASNRQMTVLGIAGIEAVASGTGGEPCIEMWQQATSGNNVFSVFYTEGTLTTRGSISYNRVAGLTAYNTTSDYRAKDIISQVLNSGEVIDSVPVYMGKMKGAIQARPMFIAHETPDYAHTGEKDAVDENGNPVYQQMDASALVPVLWAEVQSLRKRLINLETKG